MSRFFKNVLHALGSYTPLGMFGLYESMSRKGSTNTPVGSAAGSVGYETPAAEGEKKAAGDKAVADAATAVRQAEFEASTKAGLERLALKRKKGFGASMIVNPTLGSSSTLGG